MRGLEQISTGILASVQESANSFLDWKADALIDKVPGGWSPIIQLTEIGGQTGPICGLPLIQPKFCICSLGEKDEYLAAYLIAAGQMNKASQAGSSSSTAPINVVEKEVNAVNVGRIDLSGGPEIDAAPLVKKVDFEPSAQNPVATFIGIRFVCTRRKLV
jgi:hypothetical protein